MVAFAVGEILLAALMYWLQEYWQIEWLILIALAISFVTLFLIPETPIF